METEVHTQAGFTDLQHSTAADWKIIGEDFKAYSAKLPERILSHLKLLDGDFGGFPIDRLMHSLQTATRAHRDGKDDEYVICALLHDIGDTLGSFNHPDIAAAILKPFVSPENFEMIEKHGLFQAYYFFHFLGMDRNLRDKFQGQPVYDRTLEFCEKYDAPAFDKDYDTLPLSFFEPMLRRVMSNPKNTIYTMAQQ